MNPDSEKTLKFKSLKVFKWSDIQQEICKEMGIKSKDFRKYHDVIGGDYKNLWHEWMNYFSSHVYNNVIIYEEPNSLHMWHFTNWVKKDEKEWLVPFIEAVYVVWEKYKIEYVEYSW